MSALQSFTGQGSERLPPRPSWGEIWPIILATGVVLIVCVIVPLGTWRAQRALEGTQTVREILDSIWRLGDDLAKAERATNNYLLTSGKIHIEKYQDSVRSVRSDLVRLKDSIGHGPDSFRIKELADLVSTWCARVDSAISAHDHSDHAAAVQILFGDSDDRALLRMNHLIQTIWIEERARQDRYRDDANDNRTRASIAAGSAALLCLTLLLLEFRNFRIRSRQMRLAVDQLAAGEERYRLLSSRLQDLRESDRSILARRVHDEVGQALTVMKLDANRAARLLRSNPEQARSLLDGVQDLADATSRAARSLSMELRPAILDQDGIEAALEWQVNELRKRTSVKIDFHSDLRVRLALKQQVAMFRIAQEAFTNILRHSQAHCVDVGLTQAAGSVLLRIADDGIGIPAERLRDPTSLGFVGMQERADAIGGALTVENLPAGGTAVALSVPVRSEQTAAAL